MDIAVLRAGVEFHLEMHSAHPKSGQERMQGKKVNYFLILRCLPDAPGGSVWEIPGVRVMHRLARKFLGCGYQERFRLYESTSFEIDVGTSFENRVAFLAAIAANTRIR